ncbi:1169_t:CDS:2 [Gigaspora rosea]|nr:1169_t:CDS:2 [Gigaspora rosea]
MKTNKIDDVYRYPSYISCQSDDSKLCGKVIETIQEAGSILSSVLVLKTPVYVNLSVYDFCADDPLCNGDYAFDPGYAQPTLLYLLRDDDGVERLYPQSLAKQFNSSFNPGFNSPDIYGEFNLALNYWFKNDPPIEYNQYDFLGLVLHEMCHGLGFQTSWSTWSPDDSPQYITPMLMTVEDYEYLWEDNYDPNKQVTWIGFREYIFDKYLVFTKSGQYVSSKTAALNEFFNNNDVIKGSYYDFQQKFISSPQYAIAKEMMNISTQPQTLGLVNWNLTSYHNTSTQGPFNISDLFVVDTSNAFDPYNSINHVDYTIYTNTSDFLMRFQIFPGETVKGDIKLGGKFPKGQLTGAIGPKLRRFFETIG